MNMQEDNPQKAINDDFYKEISKPNNAERLVEFLNSTTVEYTSLLEDSSVSAEHQIVKFMNKYGYMVIPSSDPLKGEFGVSIHNAHDIRNSCYDEEYNIVNPCGPLHINHKFYPDAREYEHNEGGYNENLKPFINAFNNAHDKNYLIVRHDEPQKMRVGFIILKNDGVIYHSIKIGELNPIWKLKTEKEKLHDNAMAMPKPRNDVEKTMDKNTGECITYGRNSQHEKGWAGLLEFNVPGTEYVVMHQSVHEKVQKQKRYKIRWMKIATKKRNGQDTRYYDASEIEAFLECDEFRFDHCEHRPATSSSSHDQQIPYGEEKVSKKPYKSPYSEAAISSGLDRRRKLKKDD